MGFLLPDLPDVHNTGPRLDNLQVTDSAYGEEIKRAYGTVRIGGNIIWATELEEEKVVTTSQSGGKGGGGEQTTTTTRYYYYANFAVGLAQAEATSPIRIWAEGKLIYANTEYILSVPKMDLAKFQPSSDLGDAKSRTSSSVPFRFYNGSEHQQPDPLISQRTGELTPAYRGLCYIVFERLPLANFGNRIPSITVELNFKAVDISDIGITYKLPGTTGLIPTEIPRLLQSRAMWVDEARDIIIWQTGSGENSPLVIFQYSTLEVISVVQINWEKLHRVSSDYRAGLFRTWGGSVYNKVTGELYCTVAVSSQWYDIALDPISGGIFRISPVNFVGTDTAFNWGIAINTKQRSNFTILTIKADSGQSNAIFRFMNSSSMRKTKDIEYSILDEPDYVAGDQYAYIIPTLLNADTIISGYIWKSYLLMLKVVREQLSDLLRLTPQQIDPELVTFLNSSNSRFGHTYILPDVTSNTAVLFLGGTTIFGEERYYAVKTTIEGNILYKTRLPFIPFGNMLNVGHGAITDTPMLSQIALSGGTLLYASINFDRIVSFDLAGGNISDYYDGVSPTAQLAPPPGVHLTAGSRIFDSRSNSLIGLQITAGAESLVRVNVGVKLRAEQLGAIVTDINKRLGLVPGVDFDATQLDDVVIGYVIDKYTTAKALLQPLAELYFFDVVERDGMLVYQKRGEPPVLRLTENDLVRSEQPVVAENLQQDIEIPATLTIEYIDIQSDYQEGTVQAKRITIPHPTIHNGNNVTLRYPIVSISTLAKRAAEILLYSRWLRRQGLKITMPSNYLAIDPSDIIQVTLDSGLVFTGRIEEMSIGTDFSIEAKLVQDQQHVYESSVISDGGHVSLPTVYIRGPSRLFLLDTPFLRDLDANLIGSIPAIYWGGAPVQLPEDTSWIGANMYRSTDEQEWDIVIQQNTETPWGTCTNVLGDPVSVWRLDRDNYLDITILVGEDAFQNITYEQMLNGINQLAVLKTNEEIEIIQFQTVTVLRPKVLRLSNILRGRRGTDTMAYNHTDGEHVVFLTPAALEVFNFNLEQIDTEFFYRFVTFGQLLENTTSEVFSTQGRNLKPFAPVHYIAERQGNKDIDLSWVRRTRYNGGLRNGIGIVPLNEEEEEYEIEIYNGNVLSRTIMGLMSSQYTYNLANQNTDGLQSATELTIMIYQISSLIGRGFSQKQTIPIR